MLSVAIWTAFFCFLPFDVSSGTCCSGECPNSTVETWFVMGSRDRLNETENSCCFPNLDKALEKLEGYKQPNGLHILLGKGNHFVNQSHNVFNHSGLFFSSATNNREKTTVHFSRPLSISNVTNLSMVNLTFVLEHHNHSWQGKLSFTCSRTVKIDGCTFIFNLTGNNIYFFNSIGVTVSHSQFFYSVPPSLEEYLAIKTEQGSYGFFYLLAATGCNKAGPSDNYLQMSYCVFKPLNPGSVPFYGYDIIAQNEHDILQRRFLLGVVLDSTDHAVVDIKDTTVTNMVYGFAAPVILEVLNKTNNSVITLQSMNISNNTCFAGCGILILFLNRSRDNFIVIKDSTFFNNTAVLEGGAVFVLYEKNKELNTVHFNSTLFENNKAYQYFGAGSAVMVFSDIGYGPGNYAHHYLLPSEIIFENCRLVNNHALHGTVFVKESRVLFNGTSLFLGNRGGAVAVTSSNITLSGNASFINNTGCSFGCALDLQIFSHANFVKVTNISFINNTASVFGGAIYADLTTVSETYVDLVNSLSALHTGGECFITEDEELQYDYSVDSTFNPEAQIHFSGNTAAVAGNDIYALSFYLCNATRLAPNTSLEVYGANGTQKYPVSTGVKSMLFTKATCECYKDVKKVRFHFKAGTCNNEAVADRVESLNNTKFVSGEPFNGSLYSEMMETMKCYSVTAHIASSQQSLKSYRDYLLQPSVLFHKLWVPFGSCASVGSDTLDGIHLGYLKEISQKNCKLSVFPSKITLYPSPGERFQLYLDPRDEFFKKGPIQASMQIISHIDNIAIPEAVLLRAETEYGWKSPYYFDASEPVSDLSLVGLVGARGYIFISWPSIFRGNACGFSISFELAPCHVGFKAPNVTKTFATEYIVNSTSKVKHVENILSAPLACKCSGLSNVNCHEDGKTLDVANDVWVGSLNPEEPKSEITLISDSISKSSGQQFGSHPCTDSCNENVDGSHYVYFGDNLDGSCIENHSGVMCGGCISNQSFTLAGQNCVSCKEWKKDLAIVLTVTFTVAVISVILALSFKLYSSGIFSSWLFYSQVVPLFVRSEFVDVFSYQISLYPLCVTEKLTALQRFAFIALFQGIFLIVVFIVYLLTYIRQVAKKIKTSKLLDSFLVILTYVYFPIAGFACFTLGCSVFIEGQVRVLADPTVQCFDSEHVPYAITAIIILIAFVIPVPLVLIACLKLPRLQKMSFSRRLRKACAYRYKEGLEWWIAISFLRRFILILFVSVVTLSPTAKLSCLIVLALVMIVVQTFVQPYRSDFENVYETAVLVNLVLFGALNLNDPESIEGAGPALALVVIQFVVLFWPYLLAFLVAINQLWNRKLVKYYHWLLKKYGKSAKEASDNVEMTSTSSSRKTSFSSGKTSSRSKKTSSSSKKTSSSSKKTSFDLFQKKLSTGSQDDEIQEQLARLRDPLLAYSDEDD